MITQRLIPTQMIIRPTNKHVIYRPIKNNIINLLSFVDRAPTVNIILVHYCHTAIYVFNELPLKIHKLEDQCRFKNDKFKTSNCDILQDVLYIILLSRIKFKMEVFDKPDNKSKTN